MYLTKKRMGEIALAIITDRATDDYTSKPLTLEEAESLVKDVLKKEHLDVTTDEFLEFIRQVMPGENNKKIFGQAVGKMVKK